MSRGLGDVYKRQEVTGTPGGAVFGPLLGLLLFLYLVARFTLLLTAWTATARGNELPAPPPEPPAVVAPVPAPAPTARRASTGALGTALGVGVLLGMVLRGGRQQR